MKLDVVEDVAVVFVHASKSFPHFGQFHEHHLVLCSVHLQFMDLQLTY